SKRQSAGVERRDTGATSARVQRWGIDGAQRAANVDPRGNEKIDGSCSCCGRLNELEVVRGSHRGRFSRTALRLRRADERQLVPHEAVRRLRWPVQHLEVPMAALARRRA